MILKRYMIELFQLLEDEDEQIKTFYSIWSCLYFDR